MHPRKPTDTCYKNDSKENNACELVSGVSLAKFVCYSLCLSGAYVSYFQRQNSEHLDSHTLMYETKSNLCLIQHSCNLVHAIQI